MELALRIEFCGQPEPPYPIDARLAPLGNPRPGALVAGGLPFSNEVVLVGSSIWGCGAPIATPLRRSRIAVDDNIIRIKVSDRI